MTPPPPLPPPLHPGWFPQKKVQKTNYCKRTLWWDFGGVPQHHGRIGLQKWAGLSYYGIIWALWIGQNGLTAICRPHVKAQNFQSRTNFAKSIWGCTSPDIHTLPFAVEILWVRYIYFGKCWTMKFIILEWQPCLQRFCLYTGWSK